MGSRRVPAMRCRPAGARSRRTSSPGAQAARNQRRPAPATKIAATAASSVVAVPSPASATPAAAIGPAASERGSAVPASTQSATRSTATRRRAVSVTRRARRWKPASPVANPVAQTSSSTSPVPAPAGDASERGTSRPAESATTSRSGSARGSATASRRRRARGTGAATICASRSVSRGARAPAETPSIAQATSRAPEKPREKAGIAKEGPSAAPSSPPATNAPTGTPRPRSARSRARRGLAVAARSTRRSGPRSTARARGALDEREGIVHLPPSGVQAGGGQEHGLERAVGGAQPSGEGPEVGHRARGDDGAPVQQVEAGADALGEGQVLRGEQHAAAAGGGAVRARPPAARRLPPGRASPSPRRRRAAAAGSQRPRRDQRPAAASRSTGCAEPRPGGGSGRTRRAGRSARSRKPAGSPYRARTRSRYSATVSSSKPRGLSGTKAAAARAPARAGEVAVEPHPAARRAGHADDGAEGGRLAGAVGADQPDHLAGGDGHADRVDGGDAAVAHGESRCAEQFCGWHCGPPREGADRRGRWRPGVPVVAPGLHRGGG